MDGVGMASGQRIFGEGREREEGVSYFSIFTIYPLYIYSLFFTAYFYKLFSILIIFTLYIYSPYFITYFLSKNLFRGVTKMLSKPFTGSW